MTATGARRSRGRGYVLVFLAASTWGSLGIFATYIYRCGVDSFTMVFFRVLFALIILGLYTLVFLRKNPFSVPRDRLWFYALYGFVGVFLFYTLYFYTVKISSAPFAVLLVYTSVILGRLIFKEPVTRLKLAALFLVMTGVLLTVNPEHMVFRTLAVITGIATGVVYAFYGVLAKFGVRKETPERVLFMTLLFGLVYLAPFSHYSVPLCAVPYLLGLAFLPTFLGYVLYNYALREVEVSRASIIATVEPVVAIVLSFFLLDETLSAVQMLGAVLIISGSILVHAGN